MPDAGVDEMEEAAAGHDLFEAVARIQAAGIDPEVALRAETLRYRDRIRRTEELAGDGVSLGELADEERDRMWKQTRA
ncbi:MAG: hypothetical protein HOF43_04100 [Chloroflexi bacterium]|nr:hypothetical protein [Chloroflexota bacterium]